MCHVNYNNLLLSSTNLLSFIILLSFYLLLSFVIRCYLSVCLLSFIIYCYLLLSLVILYYLSMCLLSFVILYYPLLLSFIILSLLSTLLTRALDFGKNLPYILMNDVKYAPRPRFHFLRNMVDSVHPGASCMSPEIYIPK